MSHSKKNTPNKSVFLDANILIEIILGRPNEKLAREVIKTHTGNLYISALTAHLVVHFGQKRTSLDILRQFLTDYTVLPLTVMDFEWAFDNIAGNDYEDALQMAVAVNNSCSEFVTFDKGLYRNYSSVSELPQIRLLKN